MVGISLIFVARCLLVMLFLPFSALDKLLNFNEAVGQASAAVFPRAVGKTLIVAGFGVEVLMSLAILIRLCRSLRGPHSGGLLCRHRHPMETVLETTGLSTERT